MIGFCLTGTTHLQNTWYIFEMCNYWRYSKRFWYIWWRANGFENSFFGNVKVKLSSDSSKIYHTMIFIFIHDKKHDVFFIFLCFVCLFAFLPKISLQSIKKQFTFIAKTFAFVTIWFFLKKKKPYKWLCRAFKSNLRTSNCTNIALIAWTKSTRT